MANYLNLSEKSAEQGKGRLPKLVGNIRPVVALNSTRTIFDHESGTIFTLDDAPGAFDVTLPAGKAGLYFSFVLGNATTNDIRIVAVGADRMRGSVVNASAGDIGDNAVSADFKVIFNATPSSFGDNLEIYCTGTRWICRGMTAATNAMVFAS